MSEKRLSIPYRRACHGQDTFFAGFIDQDPHGKSIFFLSGSSCIPEDAFLSGDFGREKCCDPQLALSQKNLRICNLSCTRKPAQGKSATTRVYRLWRRLARQKQSGQYALPFVETTCTTSRSSMVSIVVISNPAGRGSKGDEDMGSKTPN
jgi:hypothetical protein